MSEDDNEKIKIILVGNSAVGKTAIINRFHYNSFSDTIPSTFVMNYIDHVIKINNENIKIAVWDTAGQEKFKSLNKLFIKDSKIVVFVYDITNKGSFRDLDFWFKFIETELGQSPFLALVGNKIDLLDEEQITEEEGRECAKKMGAFFYLLSAKDENKKKRVDFFFETIVKQYLERNGHNLNKSKTIILTKNDVNDSNGIQESNNCCIGGGKSNKKRNNLNIIFLGEKGVGKTTIIKTILGDDTNVKYEETKNITKNKYICYLEDEKNVNINLIDTNGDIKNNVKTLKDIFKHCKIFFLVFDINRRETLNQLDNWINEIKKYSKEKIFINILGNKINENTTENNFVTNEEGNQFASDKGGIYTNISIKEINSLHNLIKKNVENYLKSL